MRTSVTSASDKGEGFDVLRLLQSTRSRIIRLVWLHGVETGWAARDALARGEQELAYSVGLAVVDDAAEALAALSPSSRVAHAELERRRMSYRSAPRTAEEIRSEALRSWGLDGRRASA